MWKISTLGLKQDDQAIHMLRTSAEAVVEVMKKRNWRVVHLKEFCPKGYRLLGVNVNKGTEVKLRLREKRDSDRLFRFEAVLDTLLHELVHNSIGRHDKSFYKLLDEIKLECEMKLMGSFRPMDVIAAPEIVPKKPKAQKSKGKGRVLGGSVENYKTFSQRELAA